MLHSYPSVYQIGHKAIANLFDGDVVVQEKLDGSQISFGVIDGILGARSKGKQLILDAPERMFAKAVEVIKSLQPALIPGWTYRGEYFVSPKHNTIAYSRIPKSHIILFDIDMGTESYAPYIKVSDEAERLGLEAVPQFFEGKIQSFEMFKELLERESILGGSKIEGVVVKNYNLFTQEKKVAMGKYVREDFKEQNDKDFRARNPTQGDIEQSLILRYKTEARWRKSVEHLRDNGALDGSPKDIALLIREVPADVLKECEGEIKEILFRHFWQAVSRGITRGLPEWYKDELAKTAFNNGGN